MTVECTSRKAKNEKQKPARSTRKSFFDFRLSIFDSRAGKCFALAVAAVSALALPGVAAAQGCAMCATSAAAAKQAALASLQNGILILLAPPLVMFAGIFWLAFRRRGAQGAEAIESEENIDPRPAHVTALMPAESPAENHLPESARFE